MVGAEIIGIERMAPEHERGMGNMGWIEHGDASYIEMKNRDIAALRAKVAALEAELADMRTYSHETVRGLVDWRDARLKALEAENGRLREALEKAHIGLMLCSPLPGYDMQTLRIVRAALAQQPSPAQDKEQG